MRRSRARCSFSPRSVYHPVHKTSSTTGPIHIAVERATIALIGSRKTGTADRRRPVRRGRAAGRPLAASAAVGTGPTWASVAHLGQCVLLAKLP